MENLKKIWNGLWTFAAFFFGILATFIFPPPSYYAQDSSLVDLGKWVAAIIVGLILVLTLFWGLKENTRGWWITALTILMLFLVCWFSYRHLTDKWTCLCDPSQNTKYLIGSNPKAPIPDGSGSCEWLADNSCRPENVWTKDSINRNWQILGGMYILSLSLGVICMMCVIQAIYCSLKSDDEPSG